jgi:hypothetical protein
MKETLQKLNNTLGNCFKPCPLSEIRIQNATFSYNETFKTVPRPALPFPNGIMRTYARAYNNKDNNIFTLNFAVKIRRIWNNKN